MGLPLQDNGSVRPAKAFSVLFERIGETFFSRSSLLLQLYRMRLSSALIIVLPLLFLTGWYAIAAYTAHLRYVAAFQRSDPLTRELYHIHLHDRLTHDLRRLVMPEPAGNSPLPTYAIRIGNADLDFLGSKLPPVEAPDSYVKGYIKKGREVHEAQLRYKGTKPWHWIAPQKSWKVRLAQGEFLDGLSTFNLSNTAEPFPVDEQIVMDVARQQGLLTPEYFPFRMQLNNAYMGVYFFSAEPDEGLLRNERRMPGSIFSGDEAPLDEETGVSALWDSEVHWEKNAARFPELMKDKSELAALLDVVGEGTQQQFARFARDHIDVEKFALFDALDVVFGSNQHDFGSNHMIYFDPYRGRFEPVAWNFRGWKHRRQLNRTENPILIRLKDLPEYITVRNRIVFELLQADCSPAQIRKRAADLLQDLETDQASDPYWDAYHLFPQVSKYHRQMVRPMTFERQEVILESRMSMYEIRSQFIMDELRDVTMEAGLFSPPPPTPAVLQEPAEDDLEQPSELPLTAPSFVDVVVDGRSGIRIVTIKASWDADCKPPSLEIFADTNLSGFLEPGIDEALTPAIDPDSRAQVEIDLYPGSWLKARKSVHRNRGAVRAKPVARRYRLFFTSAPCVPRNVEIRGEVLVTGSEIVASALRSPITEEIPVTTCDELVAGLVAGHSSVHPWCLEDEKQEELHIGPGVVNIDETRVYGTGQRVVIEPGTTLTMAEGASLIFRARLTAVGTVDQPITFVSAHETWGGIALQGPGTAGSRISHVVARGGTFPTWKLVSYPGMINVHDTEDIEISDCTFGYNDESDEVVHGAFVEGFVIDDCTFFDSHSDAVDLEFCEGELDDLRIVDAGDECVDLMGSKVKITDSILVDCNASAISAGEETKVEVKNTLVVGSTRGLLVKNASKANLDKVLFAHNKTALHLTPVSDRYDAKSSVKAKKLYAVGCKKISVVEGGGKLKGIKKIVETLEGESLRKLKSEVLGLEHWKDLDALIQSLRTELEP